MIDPIKILQRAWHILWNYRALWVFGLILAIAAGGFSSGNGGNNNSVQYRERYQGPSYGSVQEAMDDIQQKAQSIFTDGIPGTEISGTDVVNFLWAMGILVVLLILTGIIVAALYYASVTAVIRMVNEYEETGAKLTVREGFRIGWSRTAWRVFLINLLVNLPWILFFLALLVTGAIILVAAINGSLAFGAVGVVVMIGLLIIGIFVVVVLSLILSLLKPFFWRVCVLEDVGVREALGRGLAMARENWKSAGLMWLVMIGLGIAWIIAWIIIMILSIPILLITVLVAAVVAAIPALLLAGLFSLFFSGPLAWITAGIFVAPLFFIIAFSPWILVDSWKMVFTSTVWTLTYREIRALPALRAALIDDLEPVGD